MERLFSVALATLMGTLFAVLGVQAQSAEKVPPIKTVVLTTLATTTTAMTETTTTTTTTTTTPVALPANVPSDQSKRCPKYETLFEQYGLPVQIFSYIAWRESRCNPKAINAKWDANGNMTYHLNKNKTWDTGLLQVNSSWIRSVRAVCGVDTGSTRGDLQALTDPECNVRFAKWIMDNTTGGLANWRM